MDKVDSIIGLLKAGNLQFQQTDRIGIYRCPINKKVTLFCRLLSKK